MKNSSLEQSTILSQNRSIFKKKLPLEETNDRAIKNEISVTFCLAERNPNFVTFQHVFFLVPLVVKLPVCLYPSIYNCNYSFVFFLHPRYVKSQFCFVISEFQE